MDFKISVGIADAGTTLEMCTVYVKATVGVTAEEVFSSATETFARSEAVAEVVNEQRAKAIAACDAYKARTGGITALQALYAKTETYKA